MDAGKVGSDFFVLGIGIGATERFVTQAGDEAKEKLGRLAYVISLFRHASAATHMADIRVDGKKQASMRADAITLASLWGTRGRKMLEDSLADDGVMELVVNKRFSKWALFRLAWRGLRGDLASDEDVAVFSGARFTISTTPSLPIQLDGNESQLVTPIEVEVLPRALCVSVSVT